MEGRLEGKGGSEGDALKTGFVYNRGILKGDREFMTSGKTSVTQCGSHIAV